LKYTSLYIAIFLIWLFHISGMIGILMGHEQLFIALTPINLLVCLGAILWIEKWQTKKLLLLLIPFSIGMFAEILGVNYGYFFGEYAYGKNLGLKFLGVPWFIGVNWAILTYCSATISRRISNNLFLSSLIGAALMVGLDFVIEISAPRFDFWEFKNGIIPLQNYLAWFGFGFVANFLFQKFSPPENTILAYNIMIAFSFFFFIFVFF